jgi:hypothetical protein
MPENVANLMLENAIKELLRERQRFYDLFFRGSQDLFGDKLTVIKAKFNKRIGDFDKDLAKVTVNKERGDFIAAWKGIAKLKRDFLPQLSNEVLSILGGLYARNMHLDNICAA